MERVDQAPAEEDVVDYTAEPYDEDPNHQIRISNGINLRDLREDGIVFDPEIPDEQWQKEEQQQEYFQGHAEELQRIMEEKLTLEEGEGGQEADLSGFEALKRKMEDVTEARDGGVRKKVLREGYQTEGEVPPGATVTVHYSQSLEGQDEPFDSTVLRGKPEKYKLDEGKVIEGLEVAVKTMRKNEKAQFMIEPGYAYGHFGCPPRIPGQATILGGNSRFVVFLDLLFSRFMSRLSPATVELLDFVEEGQAEALLAMDARERGLAHAYPSIEKVARLEHANGNTYVKREEWRMALRHYERGVKLLDETNLANQEEEDRRQRLMLKLQLNVAHCCLKLKWPKKTCIACKEVLSIEANNTKALFRFGKAQRMLEDYRKARDYLVRAQRNKPSDPHISAELRSLEDELARMAGDERALYRGMFGDHSKLEAKRGEVDKDFYENFLAELRVFEEAPARELVLPAQWSEVELRALAAAGEALSMQVTVEERRVTVTKL